MWTAEQIAHAVDGRVFENDSAVKISGFSIDSRTLNKGDFFVAIHGSNADGHLFLDEAFKRGASGALVERIPSQSAVRYRNLVVVPDSKLALQRLATHYRQQFQIPIIAVTGSSGKTTTKETLHTILSSEFNSYRSPGNFNTEIGLPLAILAMPPETKVAVFELVMQKPGDIKLLCEILDPNLGIITSIGDAHLEYFVDREALADEKWEVGKYLASSGGSLFLNGDSPQLISRMERLSQSKRQTFLTFGLNSSALDIRAENIDDSSLSGIGFDVVTKDKKIRVKSPLLGRGSIYAVLASTGIAMELQVPIAKIQNSIQKLKPSPHRMEIKESKRFGLIIDESYNANPSSTREAIRALANFKTGLKKILILGDMLELGSSAAKLHRDLVNDIAGTDIDLLLTTGKFASEINEALVISKAWSTKKALHCLSKYEIEKHLLNYLGDNKNLILVKGSRGMELDLLVEKLISAS